MITYNAENMVRQNFAFPAPIMDYIFKNVQPQHLIKLYQTCKFFYHKYRRNIILNLEIVDDREAEIWDPTKSVIHKNAASDCNVRLHFKLYYGDDDLTNSINEQIKSKEAGYNNYIADVLKLSDLKKSKLLEKLML
uniref:F-box domain-containing protein n=1 Tax=Panagrolaimus sp. ES5 TaxID=591445 RepID=A0AC34GNB2_9BILA